MDVKNGNEVILRCKKHRLTKEKIWYSQTKEDEYYIDEMSQLSEIVTGIKKDMRRHSSFKTELYPNTIFILMKQHIKENKDSWKNIFQGDKLFEYFIGTNLKSYTFKRDTSLNWVVFTNEGVQTWTGSYIVFKGVYKIDSIDEENKVITYTRISNMFELK